LARTLNGLLRRVEKQRLDLLTGVDTAAFNVEELRQERLEVEAFDMMRGLPDCKGRSCPLYRLLA
jgi:hypothetical protein